MLTLANPVPIHHVYPKIPYFGHAVDTFKKRDTEKLIQSVGKIFTKHHACKKFCLVLVHRHYEINSNEILVEAECAQESKSVTTPWKIEGRIVEPNKEDLHEIGVMKKKFVVPQNWVFSEKGELVPFEYISSDADNLPTPSEAFKEELFPVLQALGVADIIGLKRIDKGNEMFSFESTKPGERASVTRFSENPPDEMSLEETYRVTWFFNENGNLCPGNDFCGNCKNKYCTFC